MTFYFQVFWYMYGLPCEIGRLFLTIFFYIVRNSVYGIIGFPRKQIQGQTVVITGAGQGLGRQLAFRFAEQQAKLALLDLNLVSRANNRPFNQPNAVPIIIIMILLSFLFQSG